MMLKRQVKIFEFAPTLYFYISDDYHIKIKFLFMAISILDFQVPKKILMNLETFKAK
jgi:hypothetical protein